MCDSAELHFYEKKDATLRVLCSISFVCVKYCIFVSSGKGVVGNGSTAPIIFEMSFFGGQTIHPYISLFLNFCDFCFFLE